MRVGFSGARLAGRSGVDFSAGYIVEDAFAADVEDTVTEELLGLVVGFAKEGSRRVIVFDIEHDAPREGGRVRE